MMRFLVLTDFVSQPQSSQSSHDCDCEVVTGTEETVFYHDNKNDDNRETMVYSVVVFAGSIIHYERLRMC